MKEYNTKEELIEAVYNDRYGNTEKEGLDKIIDILYEFRNGTPMKFKNRGQIYYSINDIAEKIFAAKIDLDMNECDTVKLWDKCIEKAITIYFNYSLVKSNWDDFWRKERENNCAMDITSYENKDIEQPQYIKTTKTTLQDIQEMYNNYRKI